MTYDGRHHVGAIGLMIWTISGFRRDRGCDGARGAAWAQTYPSKPIHIVVPFAAGGITDILARALGAEADRGLGPAGRWSRTTGGRRPHRHRTRRQSRARRLHADGRPRTPRSSINPHLYSKLTYDPVHDFAPSAASASARRRWWCIRRCRPTRSPSLIELGKKKPGELNYGTFGIGTSGHLNIILLENLTGAKFTPVHYAARRPRSPICSAATSR